MIPTICSVSFSAPHTEVIYVGGRITSIGLFNEYLVSS